MSMALIRDPAAKLFDDAVVRNGFADRPWGFTRMR